MDRRRLLKGIGAAFFVGAWGGKAVAEAARPRFEAGPEIRGTVTFSETPIIDMLDRAHRWLAERNLLTERGYRAEALHLHESDLRHFRCELWREMNFLGGVDMPPDLHTNPQRPELRFRGLRVESGMALSRPGTVRALLVYPRSPHWTHSSIIDVDLDS